MPKGPLFTHIEKLNAITIPLLRRIAAQNHEYELTRQLLRSSTSIGANAHEAAMCESRRDFISKLSISRKECAESLYWIKNLKLAGLISVDDFTMVESILIQIFKILNKSISTAKSRMKYH